MGGPPTSVFLIKKQRTAWSNKCSAWRKEGREQGGEQEGVLPPRGFSCLLSLSPRLPLHTEARDPERQGAAKESGKLHSQTGTLLGSGGGKVVTRGTLAACASWKTGFWESVTQTLTPDSGIPIQAKIWTTFPGCWIHMFNATSVCKIA